MKENAAANEKPILNFAHYLIPSMLTMIMLAVHTFADTFVVGRTGLWIAMPVSKAVTAIVSFIFLFLV